MTDGPGAQAPVRAEAVWPYFAEDEIAAVERVMRSGRPNYWGGTEGRAFEAEYAEKLGVGHAIAVANGTVAIEAALRGLGIGPGDDVVVPCRTFIATASAAVAVGARPVCADIDRDSLCVTAETIEAALTPATRAVIPVHHGGWPCDMDAIMDLAESRGLKVIEDCAQAHGATWRGRPVGSFGHAAAFSFCQDKIMTTIGEGGLVVTSDDEVYRRAWEYKDHGKGLESIRAAEESGAPGFKWLHDSFGTNWRMTEVQAAVGRVQLRKLDDWVARRRANAAEFERLLSGVPALRLVTPPDEAFHSHYRYYVFLRPEMLRDGWSRDLVVDALNAAGVRCGMGTCPEIYREKAFIEAGYAPAERLPVAMEVGETSIALLVHPTMDLEDVRGAARVVADTIGRATEGGVRS